MKDLPQDSYPAEPEVDLRFSDPLVGNIVEAWRMRQSFVEARRKLTLQIKAVCRRHCLGDKAAAAGLYARMEKAAPIYVDTDRFDMHSSLRALRLKAPRRKDLRVLAETLPFWVARKPLDMRVKELDKVLEQWGAMLPIAHEVEGIKGVGYGTLARIVGECGDLSEYPSVAGVWKRAGLAVIDGGQAAQGCRRGEGPAAWVLASAQGGAVHRGRGTPKGAGRRGGRRLLSQGL